MQRSVDLRERFLSFFEAYGHSRTPSDSLIPSGDPTVLFTSAGMNQFKDYFLGKRTDMRRATSCQKCLRTGDLEQVGRTASHHSFFEMLGNFSFGDYFKADAIQWAWEFLTGTLDYAGTRSSDIKDRCLDLQASHLWVSIYEEDDEAFQLWRKLGVPEDRIKRFGQADNFWPANAPKEGPNGPCGPCSEIYYDPEGEVQGPNSVEVWNLVFTQFDRQPNGTLKPLPKPNIDTGMGLERLTRVIQEKNTDYETDLFQDIIDSFMTNMSRTPPPLSAWQQPAVWAIADHIRAITFLIAEGVLPSNVGRGYVLRTLIRRAYRYGLKAGVDFNRFNAGRRSFLADLAGQVIATMADSPYEKQDKLSSKEGRIAQVIDTEELQFAETLQAATERATALIASLKSRGQPVIPGEEAFKLYDTYGLPLEITADIANEQGLSVDRKGFEVALAFQQERSRARSQFSGGVFVTETLEIRSAINDLPPKEAQFVGYDSLHADAVIKGLWDGKAWVTKATEGQSMGIVLDRSPFYGEAGGQVGDTGAIEGLRGAAEVTQTSWVDDVLIHQAAVRHGTVSVQDAVRTRVDPERRLKVARSHTAAHMLHWALRKVLGPDTVQAGSFVEAERVRFDFSSLHGLREEQRDEVQALVNSRVRLADEVCVSQMRLAEARRSGALALFGEQYADLVRVVTIGDYSKELCGGTHLLHTGFVGAFTIVAESSIAAGTRRIEALVGEAAAQQQQEQQRLLQEAAKRLGRPAREIVSGLEELLEQLKGAERDRKALQAELAKVEARRLVAEGKHINNVALVTSTIKHADRQFLATLADAVTRALPGDGVVCLASTDQERVSFVMATTAGLVTRVHAGDLLKEVAPLIQGSGGGRPAFAQGGGRNPGGIPAAMKRVEELVRQALEK
ncbi:MAG: alanine--tRNA ligase [Candidatus Omnitrophica bacterium]|nr:alanine--tRNA ligase [Candidatus Omnitrophota bacterium]